MESGLITKSPPGNGNPIAGNRIFRPAAMPMPPASPTAEAATATMLASVTVAAVT